MSHQRDSLQTLQNRTIKELEKITSNTENIEVSVDNVELDLEQFSGHSNNTTAMGDGSTQLRVVPLGYNQSAGQVRSFLTDAAGHQQIDLVSGGDITSKLDTFAGAGNNNIGEGSSKLQVFNYGRDVSAGNFKPLVCNSSAEQIIALSAVDNQVLDNISAHTGTVDGCVASNKMNVNISSTSGGGLATEAKQDTLEASLTSIESKIDVLDTVLDNSLLKHTSIDSSLTSHSTLHTNSEAHLGNIDTGIDVLEACVGSNKVNVNISSDGASLATSALQTTANTKLDTLETTLTAIETDAAALEVLQTSTNTKLDHLSDNLDTLDGSVNTLEACVGSNKVNVNISSDGASLATSAGQTTTQNKLDTLETTLTAIETDAAALEVLQTSTNSKLDHLSDNLDTLDGSVNTLEACVGSNKVNVNISSGNISGFATSTLQGAGLPSALSSDNLKVSIQEGNITGFATSTLQGTTNSKLDTIDGSINTLEACVGSNKVNVNISSDGASLATEAKQDVLEASLTSIEGKIDTLDSVLDAAEVHLGNIETAVQLIDNAVDSAALNVNMNIAGNDVDSNSGNKSANTQRVVIATDDINVAKITSANELTTTQLHNNTTIAGGADDTHGTTITLGHNPKSITILATSGSSGVPGSAITIGALASMDNSNFFDVAQATDPGGNISLVTRGDLLQERFIVIPDCRFKFLKVKITNATGTSTQFNSFVCF